MLYKLPGSSFFLLWLMLAWLSYSTGRNTYSSGQIRRMIIFLDLWSKQTIMVYIYQRIYFLKNHFTVCLNILHVSSRCCIILSLMTESKIGHLCSTRDITLLGLIRTDWRGEREGQRDSVKHRNMEWKCCCPSVLHKKPFICLSIWANCISDNSIFKLFSDAPSISQEAKVTFWGFFFFCHVVRL